MTIVELYKTTPLGASTFAAPFIAQFRPARFALASYWTTTFGAPDESVAVSSFIDSVTLGSSENYASVTSFADCLALQRSFYWDNGGQILYVHIPSTVYPESDQISKGTAFGYSDEDVVYIEDIEYLPLLKSVPSIAQQQDLFNYGRPAFVAGQIVFANAGGILDGLLDSNLYGSLARTYYLDTKQGKLNYQRSELVIQSTLFIEDYSPTLKDFGINVQDVRKLYNDLVPSELYTKDDYADLSNDDVGKVISLVYGPVRGLPATCTNKDTTSGDAEYRCAQVLTAIGQVYVVDGDSEIAVTPSATDLATGSFTLSASDARDSNGSVREVFVATATGIANTHASDVIIDLNSRYAGVDYLPSLYDTAEWEAEESTLGPIGVVFDRQDQLYNLIQRVQAGANYGFRYEITPDGKRTIRNDDWARSTKMRVENVHLLNIDELPMETDSSNLCATVKLYYDRDIYHDRYRYIEDARNKSHVEEVYRQSPTIEIDTLCSTLLDAEIRALQVSKHQRDVYSVATLDLFGDSRFAALRIYDVLDVELTPDMVDATDDSITGRTYLGIQRVQVVGIDPDFRAGTNRITAALYVSLSYTRITEDGRRRITEDGSVRITE